MERTLEAKARAANFRAGVGGERERADVEAKKEGEEKGEGRVSTRNNEEGEEIRCARLTDGDGEASGTGWRKEEDERKRG